MKSHVRACRRMHWPLDAIATMAIAGVVALHLADLPSAHAQDFLSVSVQALVPGRMAPSGTPEPEGSQGQVRTGIYRSRVVTYEVRDGLAIFDGDIILGSAADLESATAPDVRGHVPKAAPVAAQTNRWPKGPSGIAEIPYVIENDPLTLVPAAIASFNATFSGVIRWVPRANQADYVAFVLGSQTSGCGSGVGRGGGRQPLTGVVDCPLPALLHEMGHAVGLWHEHQRHDRDQYVSVTVDNWNKWYRNVQSDARTLYQIQAGAYDYASLMHYSRDGVSRNTLPTMESIPPGIRLGDRTNYSPGDVDAVRRMYGVPVTATTVTSDPPGLLIKVDGQVVATPAQFQWALGSTHEIDVVNALQEMGGRRYVFARWGTDVAGDLQRRRVHVVDSGIGTSVAPQNAPDVTVVVAYFSRLYPFSLSTVMESASALGTFEVQPPAEIFPGIGGAFVREGQRTRILPHPASPSIFDQVWGEFGLPSGSVGGDSPVIVPTVDAERVEVFAGLSQDAALRFRAVATDGFMEGFRYLADGQPRVLPNTSRNYGWSPGGTHVVTIEPLVQVLNNRLGTRYVFDRWNEGQGPTVTVTMPAQSPQVRDVTAHFRAQHSTTIASENSCAGRVTVTPTSPDGYYDHGTSLAVNASPNAGWVFAGWTGDLEGTVPTRNLSVTQQLVVGALFNFVGKPLAVRGFDRRYLTLGEGPMAMVVYGDGFVPGTEIGMRGSLRPSTYIDPNRMQVTVLATDLATTEELEVTAYNRQGSGWDCFAFASAAVPVFSQGFVAPRKSPAVEYYHAGLDHYFVTASADEISRLDQGYFKGWARTGAGFSVHSPDSNAYAATIARPVCRYYGNPAAGLDSHFYSASPAECDAVGRKFATTWLLESRDVFQVVLPDSATGECPIDTLPVYRLFNGRSDANHRYTTDLTTRQTMIAKGYVPEGYGPKGVAMCGPR